MREKFRVVPNGEGFSKRLAAAVRDAGKELISRKAAVNEGRHNLVELRKKRGAPTFAEYVETYYLPAMRSGTNSARATMRERGLASEAHRCSAAGTLGSFFGSDPLDQITRSRIEQFIAARAAGERNGRRCNAAGVNHDLARLRNLLNDAADREELGLALPRVPWRKLRQQGDEPRRYRAMRDDEEPRILKALTDPIERAYVELLLHTGIRPLAALRLRLGDHVDLERGQVFVDRTLDKVGSGYTVYLNSHLWAVLRGLVAWRPERQQQTGVELFCHRNGNPRRTVLEAWRVACDAAGIEWRGDRGLKLRGLRPTFKTRIVTAGGAEIDAERLLGHSVRAVKERYYDPEEQHLRSVVELTIRDRSNVVPLRARPSAPAAPALRAEKTVAFRSREGLAELGAKV